MPYRRTMFALVAVFAVGLLHAMVAAAAHVKDEQRRPPNVVVIFTDDMGYGDLGCYGHPSIRTPHLDRMAAEGQKWTNFYVASAVCSPSRASLLTGRLPVRTGVTDVLFPHSTTGLPPSEVTIAALLKQQGYATACIGKWHLGHLPQFLPTSHGFDYYFGIPYSNDMDANPAAGFKWPDAFREPKSEYWNLPLMRNEEILERAPDQTTLTRRYTDEVIAYMREKRDQPFFIYYAQSFPHVPLFRSPEFVGRSEAGIYGDVIEEIDHSVGEILAAIRELGIENNTLVVFTSDNGPWLIFKEMGGSPGMLKQGKGTTWEGGMRVPAIMWWPGRIKPGVVGEIGSSLDMLPTLAALVGTETPTDRPIDGYDLSPTLLGEGEHPRDHMFYYHKSELAAVRLGAYKAHFITRPHWDAPLQRHNTPQLYHLGRDPGEKWDIAQQHPEVLAQIQTLVEQHQKQNPSNQ